MTYEEGGEREKGWYALLIVFRLLRVGVRVRHAIAKVHCD